MWTSAFILAHFMRFAENTLITRRDLLNYGTQNAIDSALRRMIRKRDHYSGSLGRVCKTTSRAAYSTS